MQCWGEILKINLAYIFDMSFSIHSIRIGNSPDLPNRTIYICTDIYYLFNSLIRMSMYPISTPLIVDKVDLGTSILSVLINLYSDQVHHFSNLSISIILFYRSPILKSRIIITYISFDIHSFNLHSIY